MLTGVPGNAAQGISDTAPLELNLAICVKKDSMRYEAITRKYFLNQQIRKENHKVKEYENRKRL